MSPNKASIALVLCALFATAPSVAKEKKPLSMDGEFGLIITTGNTEATSLSAGLSGTQELADWSNEYSLDALYKQDKVSSGTGSTTETTAQKFFLSGQSNYKLTKENQRLFLFGSYEDDRFSDFKYQSTVALGWNQKLWDNEKSKFSYSVGPGYSFSEGQDGTDLNSVIVRAALEYSHKLSDTAKIKQSLSSEFGEANTKTRSLTSVSATINGALSMKVSLKLDHNTDVDEGSDNLDTETAVTLVYSFF
ncbi:MAG: DUF481 domain-containing protein [Glaciecola sp.]|jgi:putative salt-induced outer membrane protein YdiY|nr:DUF481 domain-containing protein [Glaciecola sp.]MDG1815754.1 DUF481 domain-containing protein [Glaciecola sp.]MDG2099090.1 DUF481 domain-containing protein [Glaciecola sp.]